MKKAHFATALALGALFAASAASAEEFSACTIDGKTATFSADVTGSLKGEPPLSDIVRQAWQDAAGELYGSEIRYALDIFSELLSRALDSRDIAEDIDLTKVTNPIVTGETNSCKLTP